MPLSEQEQRLLDEMERHLMNHDADVVSAPSDGRSLSYRRIVFGTLLVLLGLGGLVAGVATQVIVVGVIAFAAMVAGVVLAVTPTKSGRGAVRRPGAPSSPASDSRSFMDRMNDRWDRRHEGP